MDISGKTQVCAVIGDPIEHTLSPAMHNAAFDHLNWIVFSFRATANWKMQCAAFVAWNPCLNVTMPIKRVTIG
jgi:shikimate dehydrogenase